MNAKVSAAVAALCLIVVVVQLSSTKSSRTVLGQDADWDVKHWTPGLCPLPLCAAT